MNRSVMMVINVIVVVWCTIEASVLIIDYLKKNWNLYRNYHHKRCSYFIWNSYFVSSDVYKKIVTNFLTTINIKAFLN